MKVLLIGDYCNDVFVEGACDRLSPERPVPVFCRTAAHSCPGMAGNVLANLKSLSPLLGVVTLFGNCGSKIRFVDGKTGHHFLRVDEPVEVQPMDIAALKRAVAENEFSAVVISDYAKGFLPEDRLEAIAVYCERGVIPLFVDTKSRLGGWSLGAIVKINGHEMQAQIWAGVKPWEVCHHLVVTRGGDGMELWGREGSVAFHVPAVPIEVKDGAGCGDTVLAALVVRFLETGDLRDAMRWAAKAGAVAVSKRGVVAVQRAEVGE